MTSSQMPSPIAMPCAFANPFLTGESATVTEVNTGASPADNIVSFKKGFGSSYSAPASSNGKYVTRGEMNGVGKALGVDTFRYKCGGLNTFDAAFCTAIGGYPKGAVLQYLVGNQLFEVVSMIDHNTINFLTAGVDGENWRYCNRDYGSEEKEIVLDSFTGTNLQLTQSYSTSARIVKVPRNGYIYIRKLSATFGESSSTQTNANSFCGSGIVAKVFTSDDIGSISECSASGNDSQGWTAVAIINQGEYSSPQGSSSTMFGSVRYTVGTGISYGWESKWVINTGLVYAQAGNYIAVSYINGFYDCQQGASAAAPFCYSKPLTLSFDISII